MKPAYNLWRPVYDAIRAEAEAYEYRRETGIYTPSDFGRLCLTDFGFSLLDHRPFVAALARITRAKAGAP